MPGRVAVGSVTATASVPPGAGTVGTPVPVRGGLGRERVDGSSRGTADHGSPVASGPVPRWHGLRVLGAAIRRPEMRRALGAYALFGTAELATWVALLVWAFDQGGATASGIIAVAQLVPATLVAPLGSALADRMDRPRALRLGYLLQAVTNLATAAVLFLGAGFWVVAVAAAAAASAMTLTRPVHHALMPEIARTPDELTAGNTASTGVEGAAGFVGPVLGGVLLAVTGVGWVFVAMGAAGLVGAALTRGIRVVQVATGDAPTSYWADAAEGMRVVVQEPAAGVLTVLVGGQYMLIGLLDVLAVVLALELLGLGPAGRG
jgi:MFS family permease